MGAPDMALAVLPHPFGGLSVEEINAKVDTGFDDIVSLAQKWTPSKRSADSQTKTPYPAPRFKFTGSEPEVSQLYYKRKWTDGLPIVAPTTERVQAMLKGTSLPPDKVIGYVPPRNGVLTVELAATYAVMAGAKPEYLPVIIAAAEAVLDPRHDWRMATTTTNPNALFLVINGPIIKELGIQYGIGALAPSPEGMPNATIGRAVNMMMDVIGDSQPPTDKSTLGTSLSYTMVVGENEDASPWTPLNAQLGLKPGTSSVTVFEVRSFVNFNMSRFTDGEHLLLAMGKTISAVTGIAENGLDCTPDAPKLVVFGPEHAALVAKTGMTMDQVKKYLFESSRVSKMDYLFRNNGFAPVCRQDEPLISLVPSPDNFLLMVAGGQGKHSVYMDTSKYTAVTREIVK